MKLQLIHDITVGLDLRGVLPARLLGMTADEVARVTVWEGNRQVQLGQLFEIVLEDERSAGMLRIIGDLSKADNIGAGMEEGKLFVQGKVGHHAGQAMKGGSLYIHGHVGNNLAEAMQGGFIKVLGNVGDRVGAPLPGGKRGMSGGSVFILGSAGNELGHRMRRGTMVVVTDCGDYAGYEMLAGTILVGGKAGAAAGLSMRRGTIVLNGNQATDLLAGFAHATRFRPPMMPLLAKEFARLKVPEVVHLLKPPLYDLYHGDLAQMGRGEILIPA
ncbi:formylmethanofuran dehydrogenase subunit C [Blastopirellula marina]|uniref:Formylmethanofuran dehydrogenase subunit C n=1 Tax=Blastopirellula marina TaxID=124 RepID=A0A2S8F4Z3_9BACT|nr:formylmethanofuran dehydrogenase subunit C [Blastopirellula marina]PQO27219.1 formylmethanofuran dehydrogenase subunit C [Blastopirellula marina]PTL41365.1 formylmethanofuran dehydrogenase subunit C [Blastopirellula marina]